MKMYDKIFTGSGDLKLGVLPHNEDILQSVYQDFVYEDKQININNKERSHSTSANNSPKMYATPSVNKWSVPILPRKSLDTPANTPSDVFNNNSGELQEKIRYEPCVSFISGTPLITENKSSRSNSISSSGSQTPLSRFSGDRTPIKKSSTPTSKFDPCVSFIAGKPVKQNNLSAIEDEKDLSQTDLYAQKIQTALRKEANKKMSVGKRLAPKMISGVSKPGAVSNIAERFASGKVEDTIRKGSVTSCLRDDFQAKPRRLSESGKENNNDDYIDRPKKDNLRHQTSLRKPLTSKTSQATLVESSKPIVIEKDSSTSFIISKKSDNRENILSTPPSRKRNLISNSRKVSVSSSVENSEDEESYIDSADEHELNNWQGRRLSYLRITAAKKEQKKILTGEVNAEADDEDSDDNNQCPAKQQINKSSEDYETRPVIKEGPLNRKLEKCLEKKKPSQRTWKPIYAVLKGHRLFCYKDGGSEAIDDEIIMPIPVRSSIIEIASDYNKRRHVFRLVTSHGNEYLFQAEDFSTMMSWVHTLREHNPDKTSLDMSTAALKRDNKKEEPSTNLSASPPTAPKNTISKDKKNSSSIRRAYERTIRKTRSSTLKNKELPVEVGKTFGNCLQNCPPSKETKNVPLIVEHCCTVMEQKGLEIVGIYRVPGNAAAVQALQVDLDTKEPEDIDWNEEKWYELNNIGSLLKSFLRKLEEPVIPTNFYNKFIEANRLPAPRERLKLMKQLVRTLPEYHYETLVFLMRHLKVIADHSDENKMEPTNLAIVFGPTVVRTKEQSMVSLVENMSDQCKIIETLLKQCDWMFNENNDEEPPNIEQDQEGDVISDNASRGMKQCLNNQAQSQIILGVTDTSNTTKKSNKFSTLNKFSMKLRNNASIKSPKVVKKNSKAGIDDESDVDTSGCSSQSPQMNDKGNSKSHSKALSIPKFQEQNATKLGSFTQNTNIKLKFDTKSPEMSPEMIRKDMNSTSYKLSEKTLNRINKITLPFSKSDDAAKFRDDGNDSGVISPQNFDSDENVSNSDSATSSRKESLDSLSGPSPRIGRRKNQPSRKKSAGSAGSSDEKSPTLPKYSFGTNSACPAVKEENQTLELKRGATYLRGSARGMSDPFPGAIEEVKVNVVKRNEWRQRMNLPVSPRSAKRPLCSIMPGDGKNYDEKIKALLDSNYDLHLKELAKNEMNQPIQSFEIKGEAIPGLHSPASQNTDWWLSSGINRSGTSPPKDKASAINIISNAIQVKTRNPKDDKDKNTDAASIFSKNHQVRSTPHLPVDPELSARFDNLKQKEEDYHKKVDSILASSSSHNINKQANDNNNNNCNNNNNNTSDNNNHKINSDNDDLQTRADKLDSYLKQVSKLLEECKDTDSSHAEEKAKINSLLNSFQFFNPKSELNGTTRSKSESSQSERNNSNSNNNNNNNDDNHRKPKPKPQHKALTRSRSANTPSRKEILQNNRTSPLLDTTYGNFNYSRLYPQ